MIRGILPSPVVVADAEGAASETTLLPGEEAALGVVAEGRRREFTRARACAHRALAALGVAESPILPGPNRQPLWPSRVVGSITHCPGYCAAAVATRDSFASIGIDAEIHAALPQGVLSKVACPEEARWLRVLSPSRIAWDRLLFSAKESVYKAWFPLTGRWLGFEDAIVTVDPESRAFRARLLVDPPVVDGRWVESFEGRFSIRRGFVLTAVAIPASSTSSGPA